MPQRSSAQKRLDLIDRIRSGMSCREAAAEVGVSAATGVRWTRAAGLTSTKGRRLTPATRDALRAALLAGAKPSKAAVQFHVSRSTAARLAPRRDEALEPVRQALFAAVESGVSRRQAAAALGLSVATAIRWARGVVGDGTRPDRAPRPLRFRADREVKRAQLLEAIGSGLSRRKAAAELGLPVATAIRWASARREPS